VRFTREEVEKIATLANLELQPAEIELFARQLDAVLAYVAEVQQVDTAGVPPTAYVATYGADRPDEIRPSLPRDEALAGAPDPAPRDGLFKVPRVLS